MRASLILAALFVLPSMAHGQRRPVAAPVTRTAITGVTAHVGDGTTVMENATLVIAGERIVSITAGGAAPSGATVIDGAGLWATPGLISTMTSIGLGEVELEGSTMDTGHETEPDDIRAAFSASDGYNPLSILIPVARMGGITSVVSVPEGGLLPGTGCWADLMGRTPAEAIRTPLLSLHISFNDGGITAEHGARPAALLRLRELFDEARLYGRSRAGFDRGAFPDTDVSRSDLERVGAMLAGDLRPVIRVSRADDILRILELAQAYGFSPILVGAEEGWVVAAELAAARVPVIVRSLLDLPSTFSTLRSRYDNAAILERAGVNVLLMTPGAWDVRNLRQEAGNAVANGMPWEAALAAITSRAAAAFGADDYGTLAAGKMASVALWSGDPFETTSVARRVWVRGTDMPLRSRMTALFERYRDLDTVERGWSSLPTETDDEEEAEE